MLFCYKLSCNQPVHPASRTGTLPATNNPPR